jgi:hypothetical protein
MALSQDAETQKRLFPSFVVVADELALNWEEGLSELNDPDLCISDVQKAKIDRLDAIILSMSGPNNLKFWDDDALSLFREWDDVRAAASEVLLAFDWPIAAPQESSDIYIGSRNSD